MHKINAQKDLALEHKPKSVLMDAVDDFLDVDIIPYFILGI